MPTHTRWALGLSYVGSAYQGWQSQASGRGVQDVVEPALSTFADHPVRCVCAGRTDTLHRRRRHELGICD